MRSLTFPYISLHGKYPAPIIPLEIKGPLGWKITMAYVDSGASFTIFSVKEATRIGIDYAVGKKIMVIEFKAVIGFSPRLGVGFNLLGRKDIFEQFDVTFSDVYGTVTFLPHSEQAK